MHYDSDMRKSLVVLDHDLDVARGNLECDTKKSLLVLEHATNESLKSLSVASPFQVEL